MSSCLEGVSAVIYLRDFNASYLKLFFFPASVIFYVLQLRATQDVVPARVKQHHLELVGDVAFLTPAQSCSVRI